MRALPQSGKVRHRRGWRQRLRRKGGVVRRLCLRDARLLRASERTDSLVPRQSLLLLRRRAVPAQAGRGGSGREARRSDGVLRRTQQIFRALADAGRGLDVLEHHARADGGGRSARRGGSADAAQSRPQPRLDDALLCRRAGRWHFPSAGGVGRVHQLHRPGGRPYPPEEC